MGIVAEWSRERLKSHVVLLKGPQVDLLSEGQLSLRQKCWQRLLFLCWALPPTQPAHTGWHQVWVSINLDILFAPFRWFHETTPQPNYRPTQAISGGYSHPERGDSAGTRTLLNRILLCEVSTSTNSPLLKSWPVLTTRLHSNRMAHTTYSGSTQLRGPGQLHCWTPQEATTWGHSAKSRRHSSST